MPGFRLVCSPSALAGAPAGWAREMLRDGEVGLVAAEGLDAVNRLAHELDLASVPVLRGEATRAEQDATVIAYAGSLPLVWVADEFSDAVGDWARKRGPMTLLVTAGGPLPDEECRRIERFVAILGRQSE
jgi:hypothetical protein